MLLAQIPTDAGIAGVTFIVLVILLLPFILVLVALWRIGTGLQQIAQALGYGNHMVSLASAVVRTGDHLDALADAQVAQATALERTAKAHEDSVKLTQGDEGA